MIFIGGFFLGGKTFSAKSVFPQTPFPKVWGSVAGGDYFTMLLAFPRTMGRYKYDGVYSKECSLIKCTVFKTDIYKVPFRGMFRLRST